MRFTANFYARVLGAIGLAYAGFSFGRANSAVPATDEQVWATSLLMLCGAALGLIMTPYLTIHPLRHITRALRTLPFFELVGMGLGMLAGLLIAVLLTIPLSRLPGALGAFSPLVAALILSYLGSTIATARRADILELLHTERRSPTPAVRQRTIVDTSIIVDGRIADVVKIGFVTGTLMVPIFVLHELQQLADSADNLTRAKGKRGLDVLNDLQKSKQVEVVISDVEIPGVHDVDDKLVAFARLEDVPLLTNDMNLERVAQLQGVKVLNLNKLADAVRIPYIAGDHITVTVRSEGRERDQGVGFSEDGTMIVVEDARSLIGQEVHAVVTRVYTTQTGRIIFAQLNHSPAGHGGS